MPQYLSPGVYVEEVPSGSAPIAGVSTSIAGFIGKVSNDVVMPGQPGTKDNTERELFEIDTTDDIVKALDGGEIPTRIKGEFLKKGLRLTTTAVTITKESASAWRITDDTRVFNLEKDNSSLKCHQQDLFSVAATDEDLTTLKGGNLPESVKSKFSELQTPLSTTPKVEPITEGSSWKITDGDRVFRLEKDNSSLKCHQRDLFSVARIDEALTTLKGGNLPESVKSKFSELQTPLSATPKVEPITEGSSWKITDGDRVFHLEKDNSSFECHQWDLFSVAATDEALTTLKGGNLPESVKSKFSTLQPPLSATPKVEPITEGTSWSITDSNRVFRLEKDGSSLKCHQRDLFSVAATDEFLKTLKGGNLPESVKSKFSTLQPPLSATPKVEPIGSAWKIDDGTRKYSLKNDNSKLVCHQTQGEKPHPRAIVNEPKLVTNMEQFKKSFGLFQVGNKTLAHAVFGFFKNGGSRCWVTRTSDEVDASNVNPALTSLEAIDEITMVAIPGDHVNASGVQGNAGSGGRRKAVLGAVIDHCEKMRDRFAILDGRLKPPGNLTSDNIKGGVRDSKYAAMYFPWIKVANPVTGKEEDVPPSGHMAGVYARVDTNRGVHKAPANEVIRGVVELERRLSKAEHDGLNPDGINVIRNFRDKPTVWGARTLGGDANTEWKYINVRRLFIFLRESIDEGTQWTVFEPNDSWLWAKITRNVSAFLTNVWRSGALFGASPADAFYVKCDEETNPPEVRDAGQVVTEIGVAVVKPAEFVIFRISQWAGPGQ